ncbi:accessory gene regulator ArgB-like protein [Paenibacillus alvei]|nr:accessory gene regulator B family protein [Paenibacillus alvei]EJW14470.1 hypothetical protein PAV_13c00890 [Paenibacillus alvei DSM 29]
MIERWANYMALRIKAADPEGQTSVEVMEYGLGVYLNFFVTVILSCLGGWVTGEIINTLIAAAAFGILRYFSGGVHMKSLTACAIVSALIFTLIPHIELSASIVLILNTVAVGIFLICAPNTYEELARPLLSNTVSKILAVIIVLFNFIIVSPVLALVFMVQGILILPWKGGRKL